MNNFSIKQIVSGAIWTVLTVVVMYVLVAIVLTFDASDGTYPGDLYYWLKMDQFAHWFLSLVFGRG